MLHQTLQRALLYRHVGRLFIASKGAAPLRAFSVAAPRFIEHGDPKDKIRFFEQDHLESKTRVEVDPEAEERTELEEAKRQLSDIEQELELFKRGPFSPDSPFMNELPEQERAIVLEALRKYDAEHPQDNPLAGLKNVFDEELDGMLREEFEGLAKEETDDWNPDEPIAESQSPSSKRPFEVALDDTEMYPYVDRFNAYLRNFVDKSDGAVAEQLWKCYRRCKQSVPAFLKSISQETASIIWNSQSQGKAPHTARASRLQTLLDDIRSVGRTPTLSQIFTYIEALYDEGNTGKALELWEAQRVNLIQGKPDVEAYWTLGVQLFAAEADPQRAQDIAFSFLLHDKDDHQRSLIPVILAWGRKSESEAASKAWALYLKFKTLLGNNMTMEDYDKISVGLLKAGKVDLAVAVFKDMMVTGKDPRDDSTSLYRAALGLAGNLQASSISEHEVNKVSLSALTILPRRFQNKFFYASWMKKLIGMGEVDSAALLAELMYERGVRPDAIHLNGMIAAWIRRGDAKSRDTAERLAWAMVQQRIDIIRTRGSPQQASEAPLKAFKYKASSGVPVPKFLQRTVPPAKIETFSILLTHYTRRGDEQMVEHVTRCLHDAQIPPNSYFMNHLLYAQLRRRDIHSLWSKYKTMSTDIQPDLETFACLWDCAKVQYDRGRAPFDSNFPSARSLYSEMMRWFSTLTRRGQRIAQEEFSKDLYDQIIRCFCLSRDLHGTLVALFSIKDAFGYFPNDDTAQMLVLQVSRMAAVPPGTPKRRLRRLSSTPRIKENIAHVNTLLKLISERKISTLESQGLPLEQLDPSEKEQFKLEIMADFLRVVIERITTTIPSKKAQDEIAAAAAAMGVENIDTTTSAQ
ncbi:hypothetical protein Egran_02915 [Elaphomyces granulatus]|uniref:Pentatricopeptide repeat protein n=1 Tax=Elaphomyces granulatus TaxID=519963 RepID=A0A232LYT1_9EURO|nr:hypothetical protein Egran_02915 [Elaphomyces granulatus]